MKTALVGYTGFVGSNLLKSHNFQGLYNSKNVQEAYGTNPDLLIYSGIRAEKFVANKYPEKDYDIILEAIENIKKINPKRLVIISTIDVYKTPASVDETTLIDENDLLPYGKNRRELEKWVESNFTDYLIVRLPGLFGVNIKKNFIYDIINFIPSLLNKQKFDELVLKNSKLQDFYHINTDGFYKCKDLNSIEITNLKKILIDLNFSALNFTDSRGVFQFYNLKNLWTHINIALQNSINILNLATEPISVEELYSYICNTSFKNEITENPPYYDFKTVHYKIFNGTNGYIFSKDQVLKEIKEFVGGKQ